MGERRRRFRAGWLRRWLRRADDLGRQTARWGSAVVIDGPALLGERAAFTGMERNGDTSVGGSARFVEAADGWVVLNLPRPEDVESLTALVGQSLDADDWSAIAAGIASLSGAHLVETATLLGIPRGGPLELFPTGGHA